MIIKYEIGVDFICDHCGRKETVSCSKAEFSGEENIRLKIAKNMMGIEGRCWAFASKRYGKKQTLCPSCRWPFDDESDGKEERA